MGPVETAIRSLFRLLETLYTFGRWEPFVIERVDNRGIGLILGATRTTPLTKESLVTTQFEPTSGWGIGACTRRRPSQ